MAGSHAITYQKTTESLVTNNQQVMGELNCSIQLFIYTDNKIVKFLL